MTLGLVLLYAFAIYSFNRSMKKAFGPEFQKDMQDFGTALKGTAGEALFEHGTVIPSKANMPVGSNTIEQGKSLLAAYRKNPEKFKKYGALLQTALNASAVGDAVRQIPASEKLPSDSLSVTSLRGDQKIDAWDHPYCLLASGNRLAIGPWLTILEQLDRLRLGLQAPEKTVLGLFHCLFDRVFLGASINNQYHFARRTLIEFSLSREEIPL